MKRVRPRKAVPELSLARNNQKGKQRTSVWPALEDSIRFLTALEAGGTPGVARASPHQPLARLAGSRLLVVFHGGAAQATKFNFDSRLPSPGANTTHLVLPSLRSSSNRSSSFPSPTEAVPGRF